MAGLSGARTMHAAVLEGIGRIEVREVPVRPPGAHEVLVRVQAVGLCGTDVHIFAGHANYNRDERGRVIPLHESPQILGHEIAGVVVECGAAVSDLAPGQAVVIDQGRTCVGERRDPRCEYCETGDSHQCERYAEHGITGLPGGLATFVTVPAVNAIRRGSGLDAAEAALVEPLGCIVHSVTMLTETPARYTLDGDRPVRTALVTGAGPAGLLFIQYLRRVRGFTGRVLAVEPNPRKRALAERFGAEVIDPTHEEMVAAVQERTDGHRVELLIEASGSASVFAAIPAMLRKQGTLLLYGHGHTGMDLSVISGVQFLEPTLLTPAGASGGFLPDGRPATYVRALELLEGGLIEVAPIISHRYPSLDRVAGALSADHRDPSYVKGVVTLTAN